jgi:uridine kinase
MTIFVAIVGPVASGKSTLAKELKRRWPHLVEVIQADNYYKDRSNVLAHERDENGDINYDLPDAIEFSLLLEHLFALQKGEPVPHAPSYDFQSHTRSCNRSLEARQIIVVEGHQLLHGIPHERFVWDFAIYVDASPEVCFVRRLLRDTSETRMACDVARQHVTRTVPAQLEFGDAQRKHCNLVSHDFDVMKECLFTFVTLYSLPSRKVSDGSASEKYEFA